MVNEIGTPKPKEPKRTLEDEFKDLHLNLPVLEVLTHALMYNAILDKYVESLELGKNRSAFIRGKMPEKMKDPRLFTLPCRLGDSKPFDTLADLTSCEMARDAEPNPFKDVLVFQKMVEFLGAIPINLERNMWESEELIEERIDWNRPTKGGDGA
ncbi:hypothetical protein Tco_1408896 [Tanacetum coccineum]